MFSKKLKRVFFTFVVVVLLVCMGVIGITLGYNFVLSQSARFDELEKLADVDKAITVDTPGAVMVVIRRGDSVSDIADQLEELGLVENTMVFELVSKYNGFDSGYLEGTHYLTKDLSYDEMMFYLTQKPKTVKVTFPEGITYIQLKNKLRLAGLLFDEAELDALMNSPREYVSDYSFLELLGDVDPDRDFILDGYLFPDTYYFDINASEDTIIRTFLRNTERKIPRELFERADSLGLTWDEVMTLASIIQQESGRIADMFTISSVFHNRLNSSDFGHRLESCATNNYIREKVGLPPSWYATTEEINTPDPYNTYSSGGLPPGAICMPGLDAIQAALYPEKTNYFYFLSKGNRETAFARTQAEQEANRKKYEEFWNDNPRENPLDEDEDTGDAPETFMDE